MGQNSLTGLIPTIYQALDVVSREQVGFIPAVSRDAAGERAAVGEQILVPVTQPQTLIDNTPAVISPDAGDQTIGSVPMFITKSKSYPVRWNGEQQKGMRNAGTYDNVLGQQFEQAFRVICNAVEGDCFTAAYQAASRAYGTPGTAPFSVAGDLSDFANTRKILDDNGCPQSDMQLVMGSAAVANLRGKQTILLRGNESGSLALLRQGSISAEPVDGFTLHNSNAVQLVTKGTGTGYVTSGSTANGTNALALVTGTGTVNAGDVVTLGSDTNKYVVNTGVSAPGTVTVGTPGLIATAASGTALSIGNSYVPNMAFSKSAIQLIARAPAMPVDEHGKSMDAAEDVMLIEDPISGLVFQVAMYRQFRQVLYLVGLAWGVTAIKPNHIAILQG